jgi:hypothetical protein
LDIDLKDENDRLFYRHQIFKVNTQDIIKTKNKNEKFDYNFGEKFDTEKHISNLAKNQAQKRLLEKEQEEIDEDALLASQRQLEQEEEKDATLASQRQEKQLLKRIRKQRDLGFFVSL